MSYDQLPQCNVTVSTSPNFVWPCTQTSVNLNIQDYYNELPNTMFSGQLTGFSRQA